MELQKIKLTVVIDSHVCNRGIPWDSPNRKAIYAWFTSTALLHYQYKHIFNCIKRVITYNWWTWVVLLIPHCYKTNFLTWWLCCGFGILVAVTTKKDLVAGIYAGSLTVSLHSPGRELQMTSEKKRVEFSHQSHQPRVITVFTERSGQSTLRQPNTLQSPSVTGEFPSQKVSNAENVTIRWHHHEPIVCHTPMTVT